jgi:hypothetical protein
VADKLIKNPVAQVCGLLLRKLREERNWSYQQVADKSDISVKYFQALEVASFTLHVSKCETLYTLFADEAPQDQIPTLDGWMCVLTLITTLEARVGSPKNLKRFGQEAQLLSIQSPILSHLLNPYFSNKIFDQKTSKDVQTKIIECDLVYKLENFLVSYNTLLTSKEIKQIDLHGKVSESYLQTPTFYIDFIGGTLERIQSLPVKIDTSDLGRWEETNKNRFKELDVIICNEYDPSAEKELEEYPYDYVANAYFEKMRFFFLNPARDTEQLRKKFLTNFFKVASKKGHKVTKEYKEKIETKIDFQGISISQTDRKKIFKPNNIKYDQKKNRTFEDYSVCWVFRLIDNSSVGFVANEMGSEDTSTNAHFVQITNGRNLIFNEILQVLPIIDILTSNQ